LEKRGKTRGQERSPLCSTAAAAAMSLPPAPAEGGGGGGGGGGSPGDDWFLDCGILDDLPAAACRAFPWDASPSSSNPRSARWSIDSSLSRTPW